MANGEEPNNSDFEPGGNDDVGEGEGDDGAWSDVDELGDLSMVELVTSDEESDTDLMLTRRKATRMVVSVPWALHGPWAVPSLRRSWTKQLVRRPLVAARRPLVVMTRPACRVLGWRPRHRI